MSRAAMRIAMVTALAASMLAACMDGPPRFGAQRAALVDVPGQGSDAEAVFAEAYRLEQRASFGQAVQYYNLVADRFPASPLAEIARTRVAGLAGQVPVVPAAEASVLAPGDYACTVEGLYPNKARWCGVVRQIRSPYFLVEVSDVRLNSWLAFWFSRSTCTGDRMLNWFSQGEQVWIPRTCLTEPRTTS